MANDKQVVFISCGQYREEEINLGKALAQAVTDLTPFEGYFAQNQTLLDGLSQHIFRSLNAACGFVAVMHERGTVKTPHGEHIRASVWVEQEIAIAAFLRQALDRDLPVVVYIDRNIRREGVREQLLLGAVGFEREEEVLDDFHARIRDGRFRPVRQVSPKDVALDLGYRRIDTGTGAVHHYRLSLIVTNTGLEPIQDYWIELQFPKAVLPGGTITGTVRTRETATHILIRHTPIQLARIFYPGDPIDTMQIDYQMDDSLKHDGAVLSLPVVATFGSPGMQTKRVEKPFSELQNF
jgi:hypothetical protein